MVYPELSPSSRISPNLRRLNLPRRSPLRRLIEEALSQGKVQGESTNIKGCISFQMIEGGLHCSHMVQSMYQSLYGHPEPLNRNLQCRVDREGRVGKSLSP